MSILHGKTVTIADGTNTAVVRPSDYNSAHKQFITLAGNTAGLSAFSATNVVLAGGNNVTLSANTAGSNATILVSGADATLAQSQQPMYFSAGTNNTSASTLQFSNQNGISFGVSNGQLTASHNGLTTGMASDAGSNFFATSNNTFANSTHTHGTPQLNLTNLSGTTNSASNGLTLSLSAADQSVQTQNSVQVQGSTGNITFSNGNGVTFGGNAGTVTASVKTDYLTTAMASNAGSNFIGTNTALTANGVSATANSSGLSLNFPAFLTTAAQSNHSHGNPQLNLTNLTGTTASNSAGFTLSLSAAAPGGGAFSAGVSTGGNTLGTTGTVNNQILFVGGNNITLSQSSAAGGATVTISGANAGGAQTGISSMGNSQTTYSSGQVQFVGSNMVTVRSTTGQGFVFDATQTVQPAVGQLNGSSGTMSFAVGSSLSASSNASTVTFGLASNITTALQSAGAYLTTAMQSQSSSVFAKTGFTSTTVAGVAVNATHDTNGLSMAVPNYITTAAQSNQVVNSLNASTGQMSLVVGSSLSASSNASTITFGLASNITTALQSAGAYLTTARASNDALGTNTALTANGVSMTANSSGLSLNFPAFLTTAAQSSVSNVSQLVAGTSPSGGTATLSGAVSFSNANGLSFYTSAGNAVVGSYTVPAVPSSYVSQVNASSGAISFNVGSSLSASSNASNITFGLASNITTALQSAGAYLTTAMQSQSSSVFAKTGFSTTTTAGSLLVGTNDTNGLSLGVPQWLTAAAGGGFSGGVSTGGNTLGTTGTVNNQLLFVGGNNITLSQSSAAGGATITISGANAGGAQTGISGLGAANGTFTSGTVLLSNSNNVSFGTVAGQGITASASYSQSTAPSAIVAGNATYTSGSVVLSGSGGITVTNNGQTAIISFDGHHLDGLLPSGNGYGTGFSSMTSGTVGINAVGALSMSQNGNGLSLSVPAQTVQPAVGQLNGSSGTMSFAVGSSLSASSNASTITFGLASNITTALQSAGNYLTTAAQSNQVINSLNGSTGQMSLNVGSSLSASSNASSITFGLASNITTALQSANANYLTTQSSQSAIEAVGITNTGNTAGNGGLFTGRDLAFAGSGSITVSQSTGAAANTIYIQHPAWITTARASNDALGTNTALTANGVSMTANSSGLSLNFPAFLTTAAQSSVSNVSGVLAGTANTGGGTATLSGNISFSNANGVTFYTSAGNAVVASINQYDADDFNAWQLIGANTAGTTGTTNTSGAVVPLYLSGGNNVTLSGNSNTIVISAGAGGGGGTDTWFATGANTIAGTNTTGTFSNDNYILSGAGILSIGVSNNTLVLSVPSGGGAGDGYNSAQFTNSTANSTQNLLWAGNSGGSGNITMGLTGSTVTASAINSYLVAGPGISLSSNGSSISVIAQPQTIKQLYLPNQDLITNLSAHGNGTMSIQHHLMEENFSLTQLVFPINISSVATTTNTSSAGINFSISAAVYSNNAGTLASMSSTTFSTFASWNSNNTGSVTGGILITSPFTVVMTPGEYFFGINMSTAATGNGLTGANTTSLGNTISIIGLNTAQFGAFSWHTFGSTTHQSIGWVTGHGLYTGTTAFSGPVVSAFSHQGTAAQRAEFALQMRG